MGDETAPNSEQITSLSVALGEIKATQRHQGDVLDKMDKKLDEALSLATLVRQEHAVTVERVNNLDRRVEEHDNAHKIWRGPAIWVSVIAVLIAAVSSVRAWLGL